MATKKQQTIASGNLRLDDLEKAGIRYTAMPEPGPAPEKQLEGSSTLRRFVGDTGVSLLKGAIGLPEAAVGVADLVTGGRAGQLAERAGFRPKEAKAILDEFYSPEQRAANAEVAKADGAVETLGAALSNPSTIAQAVFESAPSLLGAGAVARGALAVAPRLGGAAAAGIGEGVVSAGQTAEGVRQETADGLLTGEQAGISAASGVLTGLLGAVAGKVANRLGIGDINQMVAGVQNAGPAVQKGVARSIMEGFASEGLLQELPQSAQEQIAQNIALGKPWDQGVGNAAVMGALAGGVMGGAAAPFGHSSAPEPSPADQLRATKVPETGVLTKGLNAGIEAQAVAVESGAPAAKPFERFSFRDKEGAAEFAARFNPNFIPTQKEDGTWSFVERDPLPTENQPATDPTEGVATEVQSGIADRLQLMKQELAKPETMDALRASYGAAGLQDFLHVIGAVESGQLPARTSERMLDGAERRLASTRMAVIDEPAQASAPVLERRADLSALPAPASSVALGYDETPTGVVRVDGQGVAAPETTAEAINTRQAASESEGLGQQARRASAVWADPAPEVPAKMDPPALPYDTTPTGRMIAGEDGVRPEVRADQINQRQAQDALGAAAERAAAIGLTPDIERASMRAAMRNESQDGDLLNPSGFPFRNRSAAQAAVARAGNGYQVVELTAGNFVGRKPTQGDTSTNVPKTEQAAEEAAAAPAAQAAPQADEAPANSTDLQGERLSRGWHAFTDESGTLQVPRSEMPQIRAEHRGALVNFLNARGVAHESEVEMPAADLKPTQAEFSPGKVAKARKFTGGDRSILVSSDGYVLDGHHQWLAKLDEGAPVKVIRLDAPMHELLPLAREFPSAEQSEGAARSEKDEGSSAPPQDGKASDEAAPVLSRSASGDQEGMTADQLREAFAGLVKGWKNGPVGGVKIVQSVDDLPQNIRAGLKAQDAEGIVRALFMPRTQEVYLVADRNPSIEAAQFALFHEVYGHVGLRSVLGNRYDDTLINIQRANPHLSKEANAWFLANGMAEIRARTERGMKPVAAQREVALLAVEEALADRAGRNEPIRNWQMLLARLQRGLRAIGLDKVADWMEAKGQAEVMDLLARARKEVQRGSALAEEQGQRQMAMSRDSGPVLSREPGPAVAQVAKDLVRDIISGSRDFRRVSWWHKSVGTMFDMAQRHPAFKKVFDGAQAYLQDTSYFANDAADRAPQILPQLDGWQDLKKPLSLSDTDRKAISSPIFEGTLNWTRDESGKLVEADDVATAGVVFTPEELATRFGLNERQVGQYREFRAAVDRSLDSTLAADLIRYLGEQAPPGASDMARAGEFGALRDHIARHLETLPPGELAERIKAEVQEKIDHIDSLKARGYAPLMRFGKYSVTVTDGDAVKFFSLYESAADAARAARLLAQNEDFKNDEIRRGTMSQEEFKLLKGLSPETLDLFAGISGMEKNEAFQLWLKQATANRSALKRLIKRKGIEGYSEDVSRVLSSFITSNARAASQGLHFGEMQKNVSEIRDGDVKDAAERLREYVQNPTEEAAGLRGFLFVHFLGGSLASAAVNMTQPFLMTMPYLSKFVGIQGAAKVMANSLQQLKTQSDKDLREALAIAEKEGIVSPQELHQLQAMAMGRGSLLGQASRFFGANDRVAGALDSAGKRAMFIWGAPFALAEQFNRRLTFIAAYQVAKEKAHVDPFKFAAQAVIETQGLYNRANRPEWARGAIGATLFTFKQYSISYLEFMHRLWNAGAPGSPERADGRKAALFGLALLILAAGAQGLPGADDLDDLIDTVGQKMGHDTNAKRWKQENLPAWLQYGFSALPGIPLDVAGRLGIGNLLPGTGLLRKDKTDKSGDVLEIAGPAGSVVKGITEAVDKGSLTPVLPVAIANMLKGIDTARMGAYRNERGQTIVQTDAFDAATKAIGFQPSNVASATRTDFANTQRVNLARNVEAEIAADWASARFEGDAEGEKAARKRLSEWNQTNPETPIAISSAQIIKRVQKMRQTRAERIKKSAPKELRASLTG